jgi:hypothetical protein
LKSDFRLSRNLLKGQVGDEINVYFAKALSKIAQSMVLASCIKGSLLSN